MRKTNSKLARASLMALTSALFMDDWDRVIVDPREEDPKRNS